MGGCLSELCSTSCENVACSEPVSANEAGTQTDLKPTESEAEILVHVFRDGSFSLRVLLARILKPRQMHLHHPLLSHLLSIGGGGGGCGAAKRESRRAVSFGTPKVASLLWRSVSPAQSAASPRSLCSESVNDGLLLTSDACLHN